MKGSLQVYKCQRSPSALRNCNFEGGRMKNCLGLVILGALLFASCGGDGTSPKGIIGAPAAALSPITLTFGDEVVATSSQPLTATLTNSGTAVLHITNITASANFSETNDCGSRLQPDRIVRLPSPSLPNPLEPWQARCRLMTTLPAVHIQRRSVATALRALRRTF